MSGKLCVAAGPKRHGKGCTRLAKVPGSFARQSKVGENSFRFTGRIGAGALGRGSYYLIASGKTAGRAFSARAPFSITG